MHIITRTSTTSLYACVAPRQSTLDVRLLGANTMATLLFRRTLGLIAWSAFMWCACNSLDLFRCRVLTVLLKTPWLGDLVTVPGIPNVTIMRTWWHLTLKTHYKIIRKMSRLHVVSERCQFSKRDPPSHTQSLQSRQSPKSPSQRPIRATPEPSHDAQIAINR